LNEVQIIIVPNLFCGMIGADFLRGKNQNGGQQKPVTHPTPTRIIYFLDMSNKSGFQLRVLGINVSGNDVPFHRTEAHHCSIPLSV